MKLDRDVPLARADLCPVRLSLESHRLDDLPAEDRGHPAHELDCARDAHRPAGTRHVDADALDVLQLRREEGMVEQAGQQLAPEHAAHPADVVHYETLTADALDAQ